MMPRFVTELFSRHRWWCLVLIALLLGGLWYGCYGRNNSWAIANVSAPSGATWAVPVVVLGDSLTAGVGASEPEFMCVSRLETTLGCKVVNAGVSGDTTRSALGRLESVLKEHPRVLVLLLGGNDMLTRIPLEETMSNLERMIVAFQGEGAMVVLVGIQPPYVGGKYGRAFRALARRRGCVYVPHILKGIMGTPSLMSDQIHPNDAGYGLVAERIDSTAGVWIRRALASGKK